MQIFFLQQHICESVENVALHILKLKISSRRNNVKFGYMALTILYDRYIFSTNACESVFLEW